MNARFSKPTMHFSDVDAQTIGNLVADASDIALVVDRHGLIEDVAGKRDVVERLGATKWDGKPLQDVVSEQSKEMAGILLKAPEKEVNDHHLIDHPTTDGGNTVMRYTAAPTGSDGSILLIGRDLSPLRALQDRLLTSQQTMERNFERQRQDEARYRMLFQVGLEPSLIVEANSGRVLEANQAAGNLLDGETKNVTGRRLSELFRKSDRATIDKLLANANEAGSAIAAQVRMTEENVLVTVRASLCGSGDNATYLLQLEEAVAADQNDIPDHNLVSLIHRASEAVVLTDEVGVVLWGNEAFVELTQCGTIDQAIGRSLADFFDSTELDIGLTLVNVRRHGRLKMLQARMRARSGQTTDVELSLVTMPEANPPGFGAVIRSVWMRAAGPQRPEPGLAKAGEPLEDLIGKVPLKELVRDEIDVVEKSCIEAALKLTGNNRAATAKVLGLSRQGLYTKMRRYDLLSGEE